MQNLKLKKSSILKKEKFSFYYSELKTHFWLKFLYVCKQALKYSWKKNYYQIRYPSAGNFSLIYFMFYS